MTSESGDAGVRDAILAVRRGDRQAFAPVVTRYQGRLFALALMITRDPAAAEEVAQDAFVRAFVNLDAYDPRRPLYPWLATIAVRLAQNWLVVRTRRVSREAGLDEQRVIAAGNDDALAALIADESDRAVWRAVNALPSGERTAVLLHYRQDMNVAEIAAALGVTSGTIKTQLSRARAKLRRILDVKEPR